MNDTIYSRLQLEHRRSSFWFEASEVNLEDVRSSYLCLKKCFQVVDVADQVALDEELTTIALAGLLPIDIAARFRNETVEMKRAGVYGGQEIERERHWLSKTEIWNFEDVVIVEGDLEHQYDVIDYTDGSKSEMGVGFGAVLYLPNGRASSFSGKLDWWSTVYQAELTELKFALERCAIVSDVSMLVCTDSLSSLQSLVTRTCSTAWRLRLDAWSGRWRLIGPRWKWSSRQNLDF